MGVAENVNREKDLYNKPRIIAFYLPQFHPIPENDQWWGKGFTEWFNVGKAKPLFRGHKQPKIPTDLGYYDLRIPEVRIEQAEMARNVGIEGFCYWHYWFGNGKQLLERPFNEILETGKPDFPFCLGWANEDWKAKTWEQNGDDTVLIKQEYPGNQDHIDHFISLLKAFKDERYITVDGKPLFLVYNPSLIPDTSRFIETWKGMAEEHGLNGLYLVAHAKPIPTLHIENKQKYFHDLLSFGYDGIYTNNIISAMNFNRNNLLHYTDWVCKWIYRKITGRPYIYDFEKILKYLINQDNKKLNYFPGLICGWDHTPRSGRRGQVMINFNAKNWSKHLKSVFELIKHKPHEYQIVFLKSWNEWGEGNFMEPDCYDGHFKLTVLKSVLKEIEQR
jgi:hypothetical protein